MIESDKRESFRTHETTTAAGPVQSNGPAARPVDLSALKTPNGARPSSASPSSAHVSVRQRAVNGVNGMVWLGRSAVAGIVALGAGLGAYTSLAAGNYLYSAAGMAGVALGAALAAWSIKEAWTAFRGKKPLL